MKATVESTNFFNQFFDNQTTIAHNWNIGVSNFAELGWVDVFRALNHEPDQYTWWSNRGQAWAKNVGWRIDYQIATPGIAATAKAVSIYKNERFSDHAPLIIDYDPLK